MTKSFADIKNLNPQKVGLGNFKYGAPMIGELVHWPRAEMPQEIWTDCGMEFIPYMAQSFDGVKYPLLSQLHPTNVLPADMRGYFPRGWADASQTDGGRVLMSAQEDAGRPIWGTFVGGSATGIARVRGVFTATNTPNWQTGGAAPQLEIELDTSKTMPTANEYRVKNIAWHMIVRAK